jgi:hypothetical protein
MCHHLEDFIKHAALGAGKYGVTRDAIIDAIALSHQEEGMDIDPMSLLGPAILVAFGEDVVTEVVGMAIANPELAWE